MENIKMGGGSYMIIGPDVEKQMAPFKFFEGDVDEYVRSIDMLPEFREDYKYHIEHPTTREKNLSFEEFVKNRARSYPTLENGEVPDLKGEHKFGWKRVNSGGEVTELFYRNRPGGFWFSWGVLKNSWKLKPGAVSASTASIHDSSDGQRSGCTGSALKGAIDWERMRSDATEEAAQIWDLAAAGLPLPAYMNYLKFDVRKRLHYPRDKFIQVACDSQIDTSCLIMNDKVFFDECFDGGWEEVPTKLDAWYRYLNELIDSLPDDILITHVYTKE
ncbi:hypothetical protein ACO0LM_17690 [Undibacterium sp. Di26W]|uniref:hypothetical protein n=1 Tax=Undibacterium sp. Di26W TaxID=3413035 RepID=UPI003BF1A7B5